MNQKQIGIIVIAVGVLLIVFTLLIKAHDDAQINMITEKTGTCYTKEGVCLHEQARNIFLLGGVLSAALIILGAYLIFFDKTQKVLAEHQVKVSSALKEFKKQEGDKERFSAFLGGFTPEEQNVLKAIKEQDGILQSTLRYRTGMSKTTLSLMLKDLEEKEIISRKVSGKTNAVYLRKKF
jgi:uncharacterized membrane protein